MSRNLITKQPVDPKWFEQLRTGSLKERLEWLAVLTTCVDRLVTFGCWSSEPFALMWTLDAVEVKVVEVSEENLTNPKAELETLERLSAISTHRAFGCMRGRSIQFIVGDMTRVDRLRSAHFDLAYCEDVLYQIHVESGDVATVQAAVNEMTRVVKPGGCVIAVESMIGAQEEVVLSDFLGQRCGRAVPQAVPIGHTIDISPLFEAAGLDKVSLAGAPRGAYCYKKPHSSADAGWS